MVEHVPTFPRIIKRPHHIYTHTEIDGLLSYLSDPHLPRGAFAKISRDTGIPDSTLSTWHIKRKLNPMWFPLAEGRPNKRVFSKEVEQSIFDHLKDNFIQTGIGATRNELKSIALNAFSSLPVEQIHVERFCASSQFMSDFEDRWHLTMRTPHHERRTDVDEQYVQYFLHRLNTIPNDYPPELVYNMDETCWRLYVSPSRILAEKGCETVKLKSLKGEKESFTAFGGISCSGHKLPLWIVTKGKTARCHRKFGTHPEVMIRHSPSGWATEDLIVEYLHWLHNEVAKGNPCVLLMDVYPAHRTEKVGQTAEELDIELLYVPAGGTGEFQPLDRRIFGELKARARAEFNRKMALDGLRGMDYDGTLTVLIDCWNRISADSVRKAWNVSQPQQ